MIAKTLSRRQQKAIIWLREDVQHQAVQKWSALDPQGKGHITKSDFVENFSRATSPRTTTIKVEEMADLWKKLDSDGDGIVSEEDWVKQKIQDFDETIPEFVKMEMTNYEEFHQSE